jgi:hypothetical protein
VILRACNLWICDFRTQAFLADLKLSQFCKYILFFLTNVAYPRFIKFTFRAVFSLSCAVFCRNLWICDLWVNHENLRICDLRTGTHIRNLRISKEKVDLRFADFYKKVCLSTSGIELTDVQSFIAVGNHPPLLFCFLYKYGKRLFRFNPTHKGGPGGGGGVTLD